LTTEKELVSKIQLSHLANDPTYEADYYYKSWRSVSGNANAVKDSTEDEGYERMMAEVRQRIKQKSGQGKQRTYI
jgi:hypothetical protein